jgi:8-oxo-dGTP pyrophosphatase MutT (NUDIX family)
MPVSRQHIARALQLVPTHRQAAKPMEIWLAEMRAELSGDDDAASAIQTTLAILNAFGALQHHSNTVQSKDQRATYFIQSLRLWLEQTTEADSLITSGLIRAMEEQRVALAERDGVLAQPSRAQAAAFVLITRAINGEPHVLCQFDQQARQYQLVGGRLELDETAAQAAEREFMEEVGATQQPPLQPNTDFVLQPLLNETVTMQTISTTYGALTHYVFHIFHARIQRARLSLASGDCWVAVRDLLAGQSPDGQPMSDVRLFHEIDRRLPGGLAGLPPSEILS